MIGPRARNASRNRKTVEAYTTTKTLSVDLRLAGAHVFAELEESTRTTGEKTLCLHVTGLGLASGDSPEESANVFFTVNDARALKTLARQLDALADHPEGVAMLMYAGRDR